MQIEGWAREGLTDQQIANNMGVGYSTLKDWLTKFPAIVDALKRGKAPVDLEVENALLKSALGYTVTLKKPIKVRTKRQLKDKGTIEEEHIEYVEEQMHIPANTTAQIFWLKNRKPVQWRDKREVTADVSSNTIKNMQTIADLINSPQTDVDIEDVTAEAQEIGADE